MTPAPFWKRDQWWVPLALLAGGLWTMLRPEGSTDTGFLVILAGALYLRLNDIYYRLPHGGTHPNTPPTRGQEDSHEQQQHPPR